MKPMKSPSISRQVAGVVKASGRVKTAATENTNAVKAFKTNVQNKMNSGKAVSLPQKPLAIPDTAALREALALEVFLGDVLNVDNPTKKNTAAIKAVGRVLGCLQRQESKGTGKIEECCDDPNIGVLHRSNKPKPVGDKPKPWFFSPASPNAHRTCKTLVSGLAVIWGHLPPTPDRLKIVKATISNFRKLAKNAKKLATAKKALETAIIKASKRAQKSNLQPKQ